MNTNYVHIGETVSCGHCNKDITDFSENYGLKCDCKCHMNTNKEEWVDRLNELLVEWRTQELSYGSEENLFTLTKRLQFFFNEERAKVLDDYRKQLREKVEGMKKIPDLKKMSIIPNTEVVGVNHYNQAITEVLELINNN